jgi:hypothetical protein
MSEADIVRYSAKERNSASNEYRYPSNDETLNEPRANKVLNRNAAVDVEMMRAGSRESGNDFAGGTAHVLNGSPFGCGQVDAAAAEHDDPLSAIILPEHFVPAISTEKDQTRWPVTPPNRIASACAPYYRA